MKAVRKGGFFWFAERVLTKNTERVEEGGGEITKLKGHRIVRYFCQH
jgi:hypothetical protein